MPVSKQTGLVKPVQIQSCLCHLQQLYPITQSCLTERTGSDDDLEDRKCVSVHFLKKAKEKKGKKDGQLEDI